MAALVALVTLAGCGGGKVYWNAQPVAVQGLVVQPFEVYARGRLLNVRTNVSNQGSLPVVIDRDAVTLILPNGRMISRSQGTFTQHTPYVLAPGATHPVFVDFRSEDFNWRDFPEAQVNWQSAVTVNGMPIAIAPMLIRQQR
jgi:hypothetical protein